MRWIRRAWDIPLAAHAAALLLALVGFVAVTGPAVPFSTDEGAAVIQARLLEHNGSWLLPANPADPSPAAQPFPHGDHGRAGTAAYGKHPAYPLLIAAADRVGGMPAVRLLSVLGCWVAAIGAALLGRRVRDGLDRSCLWLVGLGTPLLVDSGLVLAHTLAAAAAVFAVVATIDAMRGRRASWVGAVAFTAATAALRTEGLFLAPALALAVVATRRDRRGVAIGASLLIGGAATSLLERAFLRHTVGPTVVLGPGQSGSLITGRLRGFATTWLQVGQGRGTGAVVLFVALVAVSAGAVLFRTGRHPGLATACLVVGAAAYCARPLLGHPEAIPGLLVAFPLGWAAVLLVRRGDLSDEPVRLMVSTAALVAVAVVATQYAIGGGVEWGGRYFALVLPLMAPLIVMVLRRAESRVLVGALTASMLGLGVFGAVTLRDTHQATSEVVEGVRSATGRLDRPVVLSTWRLLPQLDWRGFESVQWVTPDPVNLASAGRQLAAAGVARVVLVADDPHTELAALPDYEMAAGQPPPNPIIPIVILERRA